MASYSRSLVFHDIILYCDMMGVLYIDAVAFFLSLFLSLFVGLPDFLPNMYGFACSWALWMDGLVLVLVTRRLCYTSEMR